MGTKKIKGKSARLGNHICAWYALSLGAKHKKRLRFIRRNRRASSSDSFNNSLRIGKGAHLKNKNRRRKITRKEWWWMYDYTRIKASLPESHRDFKRAVDKHFKSKYGKRKLEKLIKGKDVVVHYRIGDFVSKGVHLGAVRVAEALAEAIKSVRHRGKIRVHILDGGSRHAIGTGAHGRKIFRAGHKIKQELRGQIESLTGATVSLDAARSVDKDFYIMCKAPILVTGPGSFPIAAAIASRGVVRTPACKNLVAPRKGTRAPERITKRWKTYAFDR